MSVQKAKDFLAHVATDQAASEKARAAHETALMQVASQLGFSFSGNTVHSGFLDQRPVSRTKMKIFGVNGRGMITIRRDAVLTNFSEDDDGTVGKTRFGKIRGHEDR